MKIKEKNILRILQIFSCFVLILGLMGCNLLNKDKDDEEDEDDYDEPETETVYVVKEEPAKEDVSLDVKALKNFDPTVDYSAIVCGIYLDYNDISFLTSDQLRLLRNTIYARHGRKFKSADLREYFSQFPWYTPKYDELAPGVLSDIEKQNVNLLKSYE